MAWYRKKPVAIEAWQYTEEHARRIVDGAADDFMGFQPQVETTADGAERRTGRLLVQTPESDPNHPHVAAPGDWIIKGVQGEYYPCKPDVFKQTYEPAEEDDG